MSRGRPTLPDDTAQTKFTRKYVDGDGVEEIWEYNLDKFPNGPLSVEYKYPKGYKSFADINEALPKTKRQYINPETGDYVSYGRAKQLGII